MTLAGKIITGLILVLSIIFLTIGVMVNASHQAWKEKALANKTIIETLQREKQAIMAEIARKDREIQTEKVARVLRIQQLESQLQLAQRDQEQLRVELGAQITKASENQAIAKQNEERLAEQDGIIDGLQTQLRTLTEDIASQREKVVAMTNQIFELEGEKRSLETTRDGLAAQNATMSKVLKKNGLTETDLTDHIPPAIEGRVVSVSDNTIALSIGTDDGMRIGHTVDIYRGDRYVGTAQITDADENRSAARIDPNLTRFAVQSGDRVTTKWVLGQR
jgi:hypothetical protein